jgi:multiple sugar transport system substrate-binding protein
MTQHKPVTRRTFLRLAAAGSMGILAAACSTPSTNQPSGEEPTAGETAVEEPKGEAPAGDKVSLRMWSHQNPSFVGANEALIAKYMEANPNVEIKYENFPYADFITNIQTSMAAKNEADVMEMFGSWVQTYAKGGTLAPVSDLVLNLEQAKGLYYSAPLDGYVWEGKLYGMPNEYNLENGAVLTNTRMFEEAGITSPVEWKAWEDLVADAKKMTKVDNGNMTVAGYHFVNGDGLGFLFWEGILERGAEYFAEDNVHLNFVTPEAQATVQWMYDMANVDQVVDPNTFNPNANWVGDSFFQGLVAIGFIGPWIVPEGRRNYPDFADPWDYISTPWYGEKQSFAADAGWGKVVSPNSQFVDDAWKFASFAAMEPENCKQWNVATGTVPALISVAEDPSLLNDIDWIGPSLKVLQNGRFVGMLQDRDYVWYNVLATRITECLQKVRSVEETMQLMHDEANAMIDEKIKS